jgi:hypothetical protein
LGGQNVSALKNLGADFSVRTKGRLYEYIL